jgi:hypothetical protein
VAMYRASYSIEPSEKTEELLQKIYNILSATDDHFSISASWQSVYELQNGKDTGRHTINFNPAIYLPADKYKAALKNFQTYYSMPNITKGKNGDLRFFSGADWKVLTLETGCNELKTLNREVQRLINSRNKTINTKIEELKSVIELKNRYNYPNSINGILGFSARPVEGAYISDDVVNINNVSTIYIKCDLVYSQTVYKEHVTDKILYSFYPDVGPGEKINLRDEVLDYKRVVETEIASITFWITDQDNNPINFRGEIISLTIEINKV